MLCAGSFSTGENIWFVIVYDWKPEMHKIHVIIVKQGNYEYL